MRSAEVCPRLTVAANRNKETAGLFHKGPTIGRTNSPDFRAFIGASSLIQTLFSGFRLYLAQQFGAVRILRGDDRTPL